MSGTTKVKCHCDSDFQDKRYGRRIRVANYNAKGNAACTVCSTVHTDVRDAPIVRKKTGSGGSGGAKQMTVKPPPGGWTGGRPEDNGYRRIGSK